MIDIGALEIHAAEHGIALAQEIVAEDSDRAGRRLDQPHDHADGRRLARAIAAEQARDRAGRQREIEGADDAAIAVAFGETANRQRRFVRFLKTCEGLWLAATGSGKGARLLAFGTIKGRAARLDDAADGSPALRRRAGGALAVIDPETMLEIAKRPVGLPMVAQRRAARRDRLPQHVAGSRPAAGRGRRVGFPAAVDETRPRRAAARGPPDAAPRRHRYCRAPR